jgi:hypothetical protein
MGKIYGKNEDEHGSILQIYMISLVIADVVELLLYVHSVGESAKLYYFGTKEGLYEEIGKCVFDIKQLPLRSDDVTIEFVDSVGQLMADMSTADAVYIHGLVGWLLQHGLSPSFTAESFTKTLVPLLSLNRSDESILLCDYVDLETRVPIFTEGEEDIQLDKLLEKWFHVKSSFRSDSYLSQPQSQFHSTAQADGLSLGQSTQP